MTCLFYRLGGELEDFFPLPHPKSLRIDANCILIYQGNFSSCAPTVFYCAHYHVLGVIFLIWVKPMQDINCVSWLVFALLFNPAMYECSKRNTTDISNLPKYSTGNMCQIQTCTKLGPEFSSVQSVGYILMGKLLFANSFYMFVCFVFTILFAWHWEHTLMMTAG